MKKLLYLVAVLVLPLMVSGQDNDYRMFENMYMTPKAGVGDQLKEAMGAHNRKYHARGDYQTQVYYVVNGPNAGKLVWSMGPTTWTQHEARPDDPGHEMDWDKNVAPLIEEFGGTDYWRLDSDLSSFKGPFDLNKLQLWMVDIKPGQNYRADALLKKVAETMNAMDNSKPFGVYKRQLAGTNGYDFAMVWFFDSLAWFDERGHFDEEFNKVHGEGSFRQLLDEWEDIVATRDVEVWEFVPEMSGYDGKAITR